MSKVSQEKLLETLTQIAEKLDRCAKIAKRKYKVWPSAYASGAAVKCRQGKIWKGIKEEETLEEVISQDEAKEQIKNAQQELTIAKNNVKNAEEKLKLAQNVLRTAARFRQRAASSSASPTATISPESDILNTLSEAVYAGNLGMMEVHKFMTEAPDELKQKFQEFLDAGMENEAWDMVKKFTHSELQGIGTPGSSDETGSLEEKKEYKPNFSKEKNKDFMVGFLEIREKVGLIVKPENLVEDKKPEGELTDHILRVVQPNHNAIKLVQKEKKAANQFLGNQKVKNNRNIKL